MKTKTAKLPVRFLVDIELGEITDSLCAGLDHDEAFELIVAMDKYYADWGFTEKLHKHFAKEMEKLPEEDSGW